MRYDINNKAIPETYIECNHLLCSDCVNKCQNKQLLAENCYYRKLLFKIYMLE